MTEGLVTLFHEQQLEHARHMAAWCGEQYVETEGDTAQTWKLLRRHYRESARYWRSLAREASNEQ